MIATLNDDLEIRHSETVSRRLVCGMILVYSYLRERPLRAIIRVFMLGHIDPNRRVMRRGPLLLSIGLYQPASWTCPVILVT